MSDDWLTYAQAAERLNLTVEAVRLRALRGRWQKTIGNDKRPRIRLPEGWPNDDQTPVERGERKQRNDGQTTIGRAVALALVTALKAHIETLKAELETPRAEFAGAETQVSEEAVKTAQAIAAFERLAQRLEAMAAQRAIKPWWQRLLRRA